MPDYYRPARLPWKSGTVIPITVTLDHMFRGEACSMHECAVSLAVEQHFAALFPGTHWSVSTNEYGLGIYECDSGTDYWTYRHNARDFINNYDGEQGHFWARDTVEPFLLELS